jgi:riboflavin kinase/FMN adenylyltransferase
MNMTRKIFALGFFDGVHLGHQALLRACRDLAAKHGCRTGVVTFSSHPDTLVSGNTPPLINTNTDRKRLLHSFGMQTVIELPFDETLMQTPWSDFLSQLIEYDGAAGFVCGEDFRFGARGIGTAQKLAGFCNDLGLPCCVVPEQFVDGIRVSSTYIRTLLEEGDVARAERFLGHPYILSGEVIPGRGLGRTIGVPTANVQLQPGVLVPRLGVYACMATVDGAQYPAVTNVGFRPTVGGHHVTVEPWLLDFEGDLYGKTLTLQFRAFLRPEEKFDSLDDLKAEIEKNAAQTRKIFANT